MANEGRPMQKHEQEAMTRVCPVLSIGGMIAHKVLQPTLCMGSKCHWYRYETIAGPMQRGDQGQVLPPTLHSIAWCGVAGRP